MAQANLVAKDVLENADGVIDEINRARQRAIEKARELAGWRFCAVRSVKYELLRKEGELDAMRVSLGVHKDRSGPIGFLQAFNRQNLMAAALQEQTRKEREGESSDLPLEMTVRGDLTLAGRLRVHEPVPGSPTKSLQYPAEEEEIPEPPEKPPYLCPRSPVSPLKRRINQDIEFASLRALAEKRKLRAKGRELTFEPFEGSAILTETGERNMIYRCCPLKDAPFTRLLFSSERDGRSIAKMHALIDGIGITVILIQRGPYRFGGFAAAKWSHNGKSAGKAASSFLFSVTRDAHVPLKRGAKCALSATETTLTFGKSDLSLGGDFNECSSVIEHNYGVGLSQESDDAAIFLAGRKTFAANIVEVWGFSLATE
jgi:hypothetical protein